METTSTESTPPAATVLSMAGLLNIFYRKRWLIVAGTLCGIAAGVAYGIIVKPLYRSTAQVRPGIVSFTPDGGPIREGALEDIVGWFSKSHYWPDFRDNPSFSYMKSAPVILAEFIPSLNFVQGGDVITLNNLSTSQERAYDILNEAIRSYNRQVESDTLSSSIHLTRRGTRLRMERVRRDIDQVGTDMERTRLKIAEQEREIALLGLERESLELDLKGLASENAWRAEAVELTRQDVEQTRKRLAEAEKVLAVAVAVEQTDGNASLRTGQGDDPVADILLQSASREQAGRVGDLLETVETLGKSVSDGLVKADSLQARIKANELEMARVRLVLDIEMEKKEADVQQRISDLDLQLTKDLPLKQAQLEADLVSEQVHLEILSPLERIGNITVSEKPVRPRKLRALTILTILALLGSLVLSLVWEYLQIHWDVITSPRRL